MTNLRRHLPKLLLLLGLLAFSARSQTPPSALAQISNWQRGVSVEPTSPTTFGENPFKESLRNLAATGANSVALIIPYYQSSLTATDLDRGWNTPTDESLIEAINYAHSIGLKVMLKVHPEVKTNEWRGFINPDDRAGWFNNYGQILEHYAALGRDYAVEEICLGAELFKVTSPSSNSTNTENWNQLIDRVKETYSGQLTYSAQHTYPREAEEIEFWNRLDHIGFAAYFALAPDDPDPSLETLKNAWDKVNTEAIAPLAQKWNKPVLLTEIGYRSMDNTHADPWDWGRDGNVNEEEQARNYEALLSYWNDQSSMAGVYFWKWEADPNAGGNADTGYTPQNKQAQEVLTTWFGGNALTPTPTEEITPTPSAEPTPSEEPEPTLPPEEELTPTPTEEPEPTPTETVPTPTLPPSEPTLPPTPTSPPQPHHPCCPQIDWPSLPAWPALPEPPARPEPPATPDLSKLMSLFY